MPRARQQWIPPGPIQQPQPGTVHNNVTNPDHSHSQRCPNYTPASPPHATCIAHVFPQHISRHIAIHSTRTVVTNASQAAPTIAPSNAFT